jgi:glycosyltransferase involved in cell wall biosynthesis
MNLACVIHRYGAEVTGGAESHCRGVAQHLAARHDVTVLTSCARDYVTWRNAYPAGDSTDGPVRVRRFRVARSRRLHRFRDLSDLVFSGRASIDEQRQWFEENGPFVPDLLDHLVGSGPDYDRILFFSYRYYPTFFGVEKVADRALLVPTAEEDPLIRASILSSFFSQPHGYLFNTPEEAALICRHLAGPPARSRIVGVGVDPQSTPPDPRILDLLGIERPYVAYIGRIEPNKGCDTLLKYFAHYAANVQSPARLVMAGPVLMPVSEHPLVRLVGVVPDDAREALLANADALVAPSPYESLSMALLEAWNHATPALVNGRCAVLKGQVARAEGGLYYANVREFVEGLAYLIEHSDVAARLGRQGLAYVEREYRWPGVLEKIEAMLRS